MPNTRSSVEQTASSEDRCTLRFTMEDTGIGMDQEYIPQLFEAFSQEDLTSTNQYGGSGLGMSITKNIVEMMGGEIKVESEKGLGSTFIVTVSFARVPEEDIPVPVKEELTANAFEEDVQQCIEAGMDAHQSKPVDIDKLKEALCRLLAKQ